MAKSITHQRLIYKINSSRFRKNNFDLNVDMGTAKKTGEIVSLGDSTCLRMIRKINNYNTSDDDISATKRKIKSLKKKKFTKDNKDNICKLYERLEQQTSMEDYLLIVFDSIKDWEFANKNGVRFNGKTFIRLVGTNGGIKNNTVVFINKDIHEKIDTMLNNGRNLDKHYVPAKFESYKALACSCSTPVSRPGGVLVIKDLDVEIKEDILKLHDDGNGGFSLTALDNEVINKSPVDGCGMISPRLSEQWTIDAGEYFIENDEKKANYISSGFNVRNAFCKGMVFTFDFIEFAKVHGKTFVEDAWGNMIDINNVDIVLTTNMLKLWDSYESVDHYLKCCDENSFGFSVAKILPEKLEHVRNMNYQFLQSYELTDEDIDELVSTTVNNVKEVLGSGENRVAKMLLFLKGSNISVKDFYKEEIIWLKALMLDGRFIDDSFIKKHVYRMIQKKIADSKKGVIQVDGNYSIVSSDLYALCQHMFKLDVTGLLGKHEFYARTWLDKGVNEIVSFRAPMTIHNNIVKMKLVDNKDISYWYRYMTTCTVLNIHDTTMENMNGMD